MKRTTEKEIRDHLEGIDNYVIEKRREKMGFELVLLGASVGIVGSFVANIFYNLSLNFERSIFWEVNVVIVLLFLVLALAVLQKYKSYNRDINNTQNYRNKIFQKGIIEKGLFK